MQTKITISTVDPLRLLNIKTNHCQQGCGAIDSPRLLVVAKRHTDFARLTIS